LNQFSNIPKDMQDYPHWILWRLEERKNKDGKLVPTKAPYSVHGGMGKVNDPSTWTSFENAIQAYETGSWSGIGFVFTDTPFVAVDIDHCMEKGNLSDEAVEAYGMLNSYTEFSQSGTGLHIICKGKLPDGRRRNGSFEMYSRDSKRYFAMTGDTGGGTPLPIRECQDEINAIHEKYIADTSTEGISPAPASKIPDNMSDDQLLQKARSAKNGKEFAGLFDYGDLTKYNSHSEADQALCNYLAFWTGRDPQRMDALFRRSALMRDKWDKRHGAQTYGAMTIDKAISDCRDVYEGYGGNNTDIQIAEKKLDKVSKKEGRSIATLEPDTNKRYGWHDIGNGYLFADWYKDIARYVPERKKWFVYSGGVWKPDIEGMKTAEMCKRLADRLMLYALTIRDESRRDAYITFVRKWQRRSYRETVLKEATSVYPISADEFDKNPILYNCKNGTLNLETREFYPHRASDLLTKMAGVVYDSKAISPRWELFMREIMEEDRDRITYLQKALGYSLTGKTYLECFFILFGATSRNGKGTFQKVVAALLGDYATNTTPDTLTQRILPAGSNHSEGIARLHGARCVSVSEPDKNMVFDAALIKSLTGNDKISARFLYEGTIEYYPQFKIWIDTNHLPTVTDNTIFSSKRVRVIPFNRHFEPHEQDTGLKDELCKAENLSGILNWALDGLWLLEETGFEEPEAVITATQEYRKNNDVVGRFLDDMFVEDPNGEIRTQEVYEKYQIWCATNGHRAKSQVKFVGDLKAIAEITHKRPSGAGRSASPVAMLLGYRIKDEFLQGELSNF